MGDVVTDSTIAETDIWVNGSPLFYGVVVTGGVVIVLILCLILVCLSLGCQRQRHSEFNVLAIQIKFFFEILLCRRKSLCS